jgi:hypothetical protein
MTFPPITCSCGQTYHQSSLRVHLPSIRACWQAGHVLTLGLPGDLTQAGAEEHRPALIQNLVRVLPAQYLPPGHRTEAQKRADNLRERIRQAQYRIRFTPWD